MDTDYIGKHRNDSNAAWGRCILLDLPYRNEAAAYPARHEAEQVTA